MTESSTQTLRVPETRKKKSQKKRRKKKDEEADFITACNEFAQVDRVQESKASNASVCMVTCEIDTPLRVKGEVTDRACMVAYTSSNGGTSRTPCILFSTSRIASTVSLLVDVESVKSDTLIIVSENPAQPSGAETRYRVTSVNSMPIDRKGMITPLIGAILQSHFSRAKMIEDMNYKHRQTLDHLNVAYTMIKNLQNVVDGCFEREDRLVGEQPDKIPENAFRELLQTAWEGQDEISERLELAEAARRAGAPSTVMDAKGWMDLCIRVYVQQQSVLREVTSAFAIKGIDLFAERYLRHILVAHARCLYTVRQSNRLLRTGQKTNFTAALLSLELLSNHGGLVSGCGDDDDMFLHIAWPMLAEASLLSPDPSQTSVWVGSTDKILWRMVCQFEQHIALSDEDRIIADDRNKRAWVETSKREGEWIAAATEISHECSDDRGMSWAQRRALKTFSTEVQHTLGGEE